MNIISKEELLRWQNDEKFQLEQMIKNGYNIRYMHNPSEKVCLEAVKKSGACIRYITNPSEEMCLEAIRQNGHAIQYINNPSENVCLEALHNCPKEQLNNIIRYIDIEKYPDIYEKYCFMKI